jgi:hypothetical protein
MLLFSAPISQVFATEDTTAVKYRDIKQLIYITGSENIAKQFASTISQQLFRVLKASRPEIPERAFEIMDRELMALFSEKMSAPGELIDQVIPVYDKHFTHQEILELLAFYQTPIGKKTILVLPKVTNESMLAGQRWGQSLGPEIERRIINSLTREGLLPK